MVNREIKFRIWNGARFIGPTSPKELLLGCPNGDEYGFIDDLIFQQFTGLKDKNNKDIYEGDWVEYEYEMHEGDMEDSLSEVKFMDGIFYFGDFATNDLNFRRTSLKIIGNIFENPELLKV